jgi:endonuclease/exonuclease/phosphatase (EEP) superfamily protein YafD
VRYATVASDNQSIITNANEILRDNDDTRFFTEIHLFAGKLVLVVAIHSLGGSHAYRHHTLKGLCLVLVIE